MAEGQDDDARPVIVNDIVQPRCMDCDKPLTTTKELNQWIDFGIDWCEACDVLARFEALASQQQAEQS